MTATDPIQPERPPAFKKAEAPPLAQFLQPPPEKPPTPPSRVPLWCALPPLLGALVAVADMRHHFDGSNGRLWWVFLAAGYFALLLGLLVSFLRNPGPLLEDEPDELFQQNKRKRHGPPDND